MIATSRGLCSTNLLWYVCTYVFWGVGCSPLLEVAKAKPSQWGSSGDAGMAVPSVVF